jgi:hypothetical protein
VGVSSKVSNGATGDGGGNGKGGADASEQHATTAADARAIDRRAHRVLEESLQRRDEDHENALRLHQLHRAAAHEAMNAAFALPSFGWRTHLTR